MRQFASVVSFILACTGCVVAPEPQPLFSAVTSDVAPDDPHCRDYRALATVDGQPQEIVGRACQQSDGSWRIVEGPSRAPPQMLALYAPPPYAYNPWLWDFPIGFSLGASVVFVDRQHHFHHMQVANGLRRFHFANGGFHAVPMHPVSNGMAGMHHG
jgi:hypothetical protein